MLYLPAPTPVAAIAHYASHASRLSGLLPEDAAVQDFANLVWRASTLSGY